MSKVEGELVRSSKQNVSFSNINNLQSELIPKAVVESVLNRCSFRLNYDVELLLRHHTLSYDIMSCGYAETWILDNI